MKWKHSIRGLDLGTVKIRIQDHDGSTVFDFKRRGKNNIPDGIFGFSKFLEEKLGLDMVSLLMEMKAEEERVNRAMLARVEQAEQKR